MRVGTSANSVAAVEPAPPIQERMYKLIELARALNAETSAFEHRLLGYPKEENSESNPLEKPYGLPTSIEYIESELRAALANVDRFSRAL